MYFDDDKWRRRKKEQEKLKRDFCFLQKELRQNSWEIFGILGYSINYDFVFLISGLLCDLLWSDPDKDVQGWGENDRGVSFTFGADVVSKFLNRHDLDLICRAHQVKNKIKINLSLKRSENFR